MCFPQTRCAAKPSRTGLTSPAPRTMVGSVLPRKRRPFPQAVMIRLRQENRLPAPLTRAQRRSARAAMDRIEAELLAHRDDPIPF